VEFDAALNRFDATLDRLVIRGHTGRTIPASADYDSAKEWADVGDIKTLLSHHGADRFRTNLLELFKSAPAEAGDELTRFRGRLDDPEIKCWRDMGPPPPGSNNGGRYNTPGVVALYLCDSLDGVLRELAPQPGTRLFLQTYRVPTSLRIADFSSVHLTDFVKAVFDIAESCCVKGRTAPSSYDFSRVVGQLVREVGFEGMVVPGVRGAQSSQYRNVVAFDVRDEWQIWSRKDTGFRHMIA
jgi:RES domain-containing protein